MIVGGIIRNIENVNAQIFYRVASVIVRNNGVRLDGGKINDNNIPLVCDRKRSFILNKIEIVTCGGSCVLGACIYLKVILFAACCLVLYNEILS